MADLIDSEGRSVIYFLNARNVKPVEIHLQLIEVYSDNVMRDGMQDNVPPLVAKTVQDFNSARRMQLFLWPAYSPDMSPIEPVRYFVGRRFDRDPRSTTSKDELLLSIRAIWNSLPQADVQNLFHSMPRRTSALIALRVVYTKN
ncbi:hypothetical protein TNCV_4120231 [Trichonephila clavipes]|nr:hypothetical protein TNCV_4120231 [Trichonephila clavipes]